MSWEVKYLPEVLDDFQGKRNSMKEADTIFHQKKTVSAFCYHRFSCKIVANTRLCVCLFNYGNKLINFKIRMPVKMLGIIWNRGMGK